MDYRKTYCYAFGNYKFTGSDGEQNFTTWKCYHVDQILKEIVKKSKDGNAFCSVQRYSSLDATDGDLQYCDLYFDFDGPFEQTRTDAVKVVQYFTGERFNLPAELVRVWYSGGKGFHILVNAEVVGIQPHKELTYQMKKATLFVSSFLDLQTLDKSIYTIRRMWRIPDSKHYSGCFKTELYHGELFEKSEAEIKTLASSPRGPLWGEDDVTGIEPDEDLQVWFQGFVTAYEDDVKFQSNQPRAAVKKLEKAPVCVQDLLDNHIRQEGSRNRATMTLAAYYKDQGATQQEAEAVLVPWALRTPAGLTSKKGERELTAGTKSVIKTVYDDAGKYTFGCAFIRSLGTGTDKPIQCDGDRCPVANVTLDDEISGLPDNLEFQERNIALQGIYRKVAMMGPTAREHYIDMVSKRFKMSKVAIRDEIKRVEMALKVEPAIPRPLDKPRDKALSLVQDIKNGVFHYLIYVPTSASNFVPRLVTSERQLEPVGEDAELPEDTARWSVDSQTAFNVFEWLSGNKTVDAGQVFRELRDFIEQYMWYPDKRFYQLLAVWIMQTYVFNIFDTTGYLALIGTKRTGKSRTLEILEQFAFNCLKADSFSDAFIYRAIERNRSTMLFDEADSLRKQPKESVNERLEIIRSGYKRAGKVGRCEGESNNTVTFSTYSPKAIANVTGLEEALEDRVIFVNVERKPQEIQVKKLVFRDLDRVIQEVRNKLYFFGLQYSGQIADIYREYRTDELEDREAEIWAGVLVVAKLISEELHGSLMSLAVENKNRKELREGLESVEAQVIMVLWELIQENNFSQLTTSGKYWKSETIRKAIMDQLGWEKISRNWISSVLLKLRIIEDNKEYKERFRVIEDGKQTRPMHYLLISEKVLNTAKKYSVDLEGNEEKFSNDEKIEF